MSEGPASDAEHRREIRRRTLVFGRVSSFAALEAADIDFWSQRTLGEKFQATIELVRDSWYLQGNDGPVPRLDRSVGGIRKLGD